jgi:hypothetical protein
MMRVVAAAFLVALASPAAAVEDASPFRLVGPAASDLGDAKALWFALSAVGTPPRQATASVTSVALGGVLDPEVARSFVARLVPPKDGGWAIRIEPANPSVLTAGTYALRVRIEVAKPRRTQDVELQVVRHAPALDVPATLEATRIIGWSDDDYCPGFTLRETSRKGAVAGLRFTSDVVRKGDMTVAATMEVTGPTEIAAGTAAQFQCRIRGALPPGRSKGTLRLQAESLPAGATIPFEIAARRNLAIILVLLAAGVALGWLVRTGLLRWRDLADARLALDEAAARLDREVRQHADETFRGTVRQARRDLEASAGKLDPVALGASVRLAQTALEGALAALATARDAVRGELKTLAEALALSPRLPTRISAALDELRRAIDAAGSALVVDDVGAARQALREAAASVAGRVGDAGSEWAAEMRAAVTAFAEDRRTPASVRTAVASAVEKTRDALQQLEAASDLRARIEASAAAQQQARAMLHGLRAELESAIEQIAAAHPVRAAADAKLAAARAALAHADPASVPDAPPLLTRLRDASEATAAAAQALVKEILGDIAPTDTIRTALAEARYPDAIRAAEEKRAAEAPHGTLKGGTKAGPEPEPEKRAASSGPPPPPEPAPVVVSIAVGPAPSADGFPELRARALGSRALASAAQSAAVLLLAVVFGYFLHADEFIGTWSEMGRIFAWGFAADLTVGGMVAAAGKVAG